MQRTLGTILVAALVVLAGCNGVLGSGSDEPDIRFTPAPVPTDKPTPTPVPQLAPGVTGQGIENANALVAAHTSFLQNRSFTTKSNYTALAPNGSVVLRGTSILRVGPPGEGVYAISERNISHLKPGFELLPVRTEVWWNDGRLFVKRTYANGTTTYERERQPGYGNSGAGLRYRLEPFGTANTSVTKQESNGTTLYLVRGNTKSDQPYRHRNQSLRLLVDGRGVIHEYRIVRQLPSEKTISKIIYETQFSKIGATDAPERPSWVDEAMNQTTPIPGETTVRNY